MEPCQVLPLWARVDLGAMAMKGYSTFPKAPALVEPCHQKIDVTSMTLGGILPLCRDAVSVFYSTSQLVAQSAGAAEYTDCMTAEGKTLLMSVLVMKLNNLMVRFQ